jgi:hypothetical protein
VMLDEAGVVHVGQDLQRGGRRRSREEQRLQNLRSSCRQQA